MTAAGLNKSRTHPKSPGRGANRMLAKFVPEHFRRGGEHPECCRDHGGHEEQQHEQVMRMRMGMPSTRRRKMGRIKGAMQGKSPDYYYYGKAWRLHHLRKQQSRDRQREQQRPLPRETIVQQGLPPHPGPPKKNKTDSEGKMRSTANAVRKKHTKLRISEDEDRGRQRDRELRDDSEKHDHKSTTADVKANMSK